MEAILAKLTSQADFESQDKLESEIGEANINVVNSNAASKSQTSSCLSMMSAFKGQMDISSQITLVSSLERQHYIQEMVSTQSYKISKKDRDMAKLARKMNLQKWTSSETSMIDEAQQKQDEQKTDSLVGPQKIQGAAVDNIGVDEDEEVSSFV